VHCYDHVRWQDGVARANAAWTQREFMRAIDTFTAVFGSAPQSHAAAGWQLNSYALQLESCAHLRYASDTRGTRPFLPVIGSVRGDCVQIPTTLPTLDELIGTGGLTADTACDELRARTRATQIPDQVFTVHAELEGGQLAPQFERLLRGWREDGFALVPLADLGADLRRENLPRHLIAMGAIPGRSGVLALQAQRVDEPPSA